MPLSPRVWARASWLALVSGAADAAGWIGSGVFAAHMTGNTALIGVALFDGKWHLALLRLGAVGCFCAGLLLASVLGRAMPRGTGVAIALAVALALFAAFVPERRASVLLLGTALAMQNAVLHQFAGKSINTSFLTGDLQTLAAALARGLLGRRGPDDVEGDRVITLVVPTVWFGYVAGAAIGAALSHVLHHPLLPISLAIPFVLLLQDRKRG